MYDGGDGIEEELMMGRYNKEWDGMGWDIHLHQTTQYPNFPLIAIQPQPHFQHINPKDGNQRTTQGGTTAYDQNIFK